MKNDRITRYQLYLESAHAIEGNKEIITFKKPDIVCNMYYDSAALIRGFEEIIINNSDLLNPNLFKKMLDDNIKQINNGRFVEKIEKAIKKQMDRKHIKNISETTFAELFKFLVIAISKYQGKIINENYLGVSYNIDLSKMDKKTFLSYAYDDKGLTQALFYYFYLNSGYLYVNWMWSGVNKNSSETKEDIENELKTSDQLLFLRTPNSELQLSRYKSIRQWCAWEIGNYYTKHKDKKYYTDFYETGKSHNDILDTFKSMKNVSKGVIK